MTDLPDTYPKESTSLQYSLFLTYHVEYDIQLWNKGLILTGLPMM